jgi:nitrite reductase/ring-hydroxylating ferredoxin subunit
MPEPLEFDTGIAPAELDREHPRPIETPWGTMALFVVDDEVCCVQAFCPHLEGPLFQGSVAGGIVTCPWHAWRFDLRSGGRVALFGLPLPGPGLKRCEVTTSARGTVILSPPRTR